MAFQLDIDALCFWQECLYCNFLGYFWVFASPGIHYAAIIAEFRRAQRSPMQCQIFTFVRPICGFLTPKHQKSGIWQLICPLLDVISVYAYRFYTVSQKSSHL